MSISDEAIIEISVNLRNFDRFPSSPFVASLLGLINYTDTKAVVCFSEE
jgi:hypothetical protein